LPVGAELRTQLEGDSLVPLLKDTKAQMNTDRMQVHHVGRWPKPHTWPQQKYAECTVHWQHYALVRMDKREPGKAYTAMPKIHHKLTAAAGTWELYDLRADPFQERDIAGQHPDIVRKMADHYDTWWKKVQAVLTERWEKNDA
jgi:hypothetical protein